MATGWGWLFRRASPWGGARMLRRLLAPLLACLGLAFPAVAKDELVLGMNSAPGTMNPMINAMLAKSVILNMTERPLTAYNADWQLVCMACTVLPTMENGRARIVDPPADDKRLHRQWI